MSTEVRFDPITVSTRLVGAGLFQDRKKVRQFAERAGHRFRFNPGDRFMTAIFPDLRIELQTIRNQTLVTTGLEYGRPEQGFQASAALIEEALQGRDNGSERPQRAASHLTGNDHPFDQGLAAIIISLETEADDNEPPSNPPYSRTEEDLLTTPTGQKALLTMRWNNLDKAEGNKTLLFTADATSRSVPDEPKADWLEGIYQELLRRTRQRFREPLAPGSGT